MIRVLSKCQHNQRCRYTHGFYCEDCKTFFPKDSPTYRSGELLKSIWSVLHNINAERIQVGDPEIAEVLTMKNKIGIGKKHDDYEALIAEAEIIMKKYGVTSDSSSVTIR